MDSFTCVFLIININCINQPTINLYILNKIIADLLLVYNADVSLPDSDNCLPLHRLLQCPYHDLSSICCGHGNTFASCGDGVGGRINEGTGDERIGNSLQMDSGDGSGGDSGEGGGEDSSQVTAASVTLYELLQIFAKRDPKAFQAILNEQKETALFYLLRLYFGFGRIAESHVTNNIFSES